MTQRYAIYFAPPPDSPWWRFGSRWLGYDAATGEPVPQLAIPGVAPERFAALTREPRRYGFHATLKAPIRLAPGGTPAALESRLQAFAAERAPFALPRMVTAELRTFLACVFETHHPATQALADACVTAFDDLRATLNRTELARRLARPLSEREAAHLDRWGYPYVFDAFRFHMTLTRSLGRVSHAEAQAIRAAAADAVDALADVPLVCDAVCLFVQPRADAPFRIARRFPFGG
jgi:putative phosphonate metabolism protein